MADRNGIRDGSSSFLGPLKLMLVGLSSALHTRLELFVTELEEERERIKQSIVLALLAFFGLSLGVVLLMIFAVVVFWEQGWIAAIGILALIYMTVGASAALTLRKKILSRPELFPSTIAELGKDRDRLKASTRE